MRLFAAILGAYFVSEYGGEDGYFSFTRFLSREFYIEFGSSLVIAFILIELIARVTRLLDRFYDWREQMLLRVCLQVALGIVLPGMIDVLLASLYFRIFGLNILDTTYLQYALPYIILMITLFNLYYVMYYFYLKAAQAERIASGPATGEGSLKESLQELPEMEKGKKQLKEVFIVNKGPKNVSIPVRDICYFFRKGDYNFLRTFEEDISLIHQTLDEVQQTLSEKQFFRLNRQMIINFKSFRHFELAGDGKLKVFLNPQSPFKATIVSRQRAPGFKAWIDR